MEFFKKYFKDVDNWNAEEVKKFGNNYLVSNKGKIYRINCFDSVGRLLDKEVKQSYHNGYKVCSLDGKQYRVHRIVAKLFIPIDNAHKTQINHKDGNKLNNDVSNLEWVTAKENIRHAWNNGLANKRTGIANDKTKAIEQYDLKGKLLRVWYDPNEMEKVLGYKKNTIQKCCAGIHNTSCGFIWKYHRKGRW
jgi:hypothetical protein